LSFSALFFADDQVPNIRLTVVKMFPKLKAMLRLPGDHKLLTSLEAHICNLSLNEKDRDVKAQLNLTIQALDAIEVQMEMVRSRIRGHKFPTIAAEDPYIMLEDTILIRGID
jgi:hypothetical protein